MTVDLAKTPSSRLDGRRALVTGGGRHNKFLMAELARRFDLIGVRCARTV